MTKLFAMFASILLIMNLGACSMPNRESSETSGSGSVSPQKSKQSMGILAAQTTETTVSAPESASKKEPSPENTIIDKDSIKMVQQQQGKITITIPKNEINQGDIASSDQSYNFTIKPGDYSDPSNAITTFFFDLYMKQALCFESIHNTIKISASDDTFVNTLCSLEKLILNLGQVDVLILPKIKYDDKGIPCIYQSAAAYKTAQDNIISFGNTYTEKDFKQIIKGNFDTKLARLYFEAVTEIPGEKEHKTYFEAVKTKSGGFTYRSVNIFNGKVQSLFVSVFDEDMSAGFSEGSAENFTLTPLYKTPSLSSSNEKNNLSLLYYLFASDDGAIITSSEKASK